MRLDCYALTNLQSMHAHLTIDTYVPTYSLSLTI